LLEQQGSQMARSPARRSFPLPGAGHPKWKIIVQGAFYSTHLKDDLLELARQVLNEKEQSLANGTSA